MLTAYHVHSTYSDGKNTIPEFVEAAIEAGIEELGISDHYIIADDGKPVKWSMGLDRLPEYLDELRAARDAAGDRVRVRLAVEADYSPKTFEALREALEPHDLDYIIGSIHYLGNFPVDTHASYWDVLKQSERNDLMRLYWERVRTMAQTGFFQFVGHIDLCKKFGHTATIDLTPEISSALDAIAESGMATEVNTSGLFLPTGEAYPSAAILHECHRRQIPVLATSDAHTTENLLRKRDHALGLIRKAGYSEVATFKDRQLRLVSITQP